MSSLSSKQQSQPPNFVLRAKRSDAPNNTAANSAAYHADSSFSKQEEQEQQQQQLYQFLAPLGVLRQYKKWHGVQALQREWEEDSSTMKQQSNSSKRSSIHSNDRGRKFAVALYWCPDRAGNVLHSLFNTIIWAMITNRTLLFAWDVDNPPHNNESICNAQILQRQPWLPLYQDWKDKLHDLPRDETTGRLLPPVSLSMDATRRSYDEMLPLVYFPMIPDVLYDPKKSNNGGGGNDDDAAAAAASENDDLRPPRPATSAMYRNEWIHHPLRLAHYQAYIFDMPKRPYQHIMARLYSEGVEFLYGMLLEQFFTLFPLEQQQQQQQQQHAATAVVVANNNNNDDHNEPAVSKIATTDNNTASTTSSASVFHVVVHSRHIAPADDGSYINYEMDCLEQVLNQHYLAASNATNDKSNNSRGGNKNLQQQQQQQQECRIVVMSDRPKTVHLLRKWLQEHPIYHSACTVLTTLDNTLGNDDEMMMTSPGPVAEVRSIAFFCIVSLHGILARRPLCFFVFFSDSSVAIESSHVVCPNTGV
jgi:hypothetical protein